MSDRSSYWLALVAGFVLALSLLGGCRAPSSIAANDEITPETLATDVKLKEPRTVTAPPKDLPGDVVSEVARDMRHGEMEQEIGRPAQARQYYQRVILAAPGHVPAHRRLAKIAASEQDYPRAEHHLRAALKSRPGSAQLWTDLAQTLEAQRKFAAANQALHRAIALNQRPPRHDAVGVVRTASVAEYRAMASLSSASVGGPLQRRKDEPEQALDSPLLPAAVVHRRQRRASDGINPVHLASLGSLANSGEVEQADFEAGDCETDGNLPVWNP